MLRDILRDDDAQVSMGLQIIAHVAPDILLMTNVDYDAGLMAATALQDRLAATGHSLPCAFALQPNTGLRTGFDIDGDGYNSGAADAQGHGEFRGQGGMLILSRQPASKYQDFSGLLWRDLPASQSNDPPELAAIQRLASVGAWSVTFGEGDAALTLLTWHAGTPAFDTGDNRNPRRNADENLFWMRYLDGALNLPAPATPLVLMGTTNLDPSDGLGQKNAIYALLNHPRIQDPRPTSRGAQHKNDQDKGVNLSHISDPAFDTADWRDDIGPGNLRVQYILPDTQLNVTGAGVFWPAPDEPEYEIVSGRDPDRSWHGMVWVDIER